MRQAQGQEADYQNGQCPSDADSSAQTEYAKQRLEQFRGQVSWKKGSEDNQER